MKKLFFLILIILATTQAFADVSGTGCKIGENYVYTEYLGMAPAYTGTAPIRYYKSTGARIPIYWGYGQNLHRGYRCGYINEYGSSSYYDPETGQTVPIPAEDEFSYLGSQCVIAPSLGATPVATDSYVSYSYMKTSKCTTTPVPLDDNVWFVLVGSGLLGAFAVRKILISNN